MTTKNKEQVEVEVITEESVISSGYVILFDDNFHTFDEVIDQLILATGCSHKQANLFAWEVHTKGQCVVFKGEFEKCLFVSQVLEEISLKTEVVL